MKYAHRFIESYTHNGRIGVLVELIFELSITPQVPAFASICKDLAMHIAALNPENIDALLSQSFVKDNSVNVAQWLSESSVTLDDKIEISRFIRWDTEPPRPSPIPSEPPDGPPMIMRIGAMSDAFMVEPGIETVTGHCDTCGHESRLFRGFVYQHERVFACYVASYTQSHPELGVSMAVSLRGWGEGADPTVKECVALEWRGTETGPGCSVVEAPTSAWASESILGRMLPRQQALSSGRAKEAFAVTDAVWCTDPRLPAALDGA